MKLNLTQRALQSLTAVICFVIGDAYPAQLDVMTPQETVIIHRPKAVPEREVFHALPLGVVVVASPPTEVTALAHCFDSALTTSNAALKAGSALSILTTGPMLDGPDDVALRRLVRHENQIELEVIHSSIASQGVKLRRNIRWRPMVQVPLELPVGHYQLMVIWRALETVPEGRALDVPPILQSYAFRVI